MQPRANSTEPTFDGTLDDVALEAVKHHMIRSLAAIVVQTDGKPERRGTGVFVEHRDRRFIATASHVLEYATSESRIHLMLKGREFSFEPGGWSVVSRFEVGEFEREELDIGVVELSDTFAESMPDATWWREPRIASSAPDHYPMSLMGYPDSESVPVAGRGLVLRAVAMQTSVVPIGDVPRHLKRMPWSIFLAGDGERDVKGMSGAGVFSIPRFPSDDAALWSPGEAWLVGILVGQHREYDLMVAHSAEGVLNLIDHHINETTRTSNPRRDN